MANYSIFNKIFALKKEEIRGTAESAPVRWIAVSEDANLNYTHNALMDETIRGVNARFDSAPGQKVGSGNIPFPIRAQVVGEFFQMLIGDPVSAENTAFTVTLNTNDKIDFTEDAGSELHATLTAGSYAMGTASSEAGTLCALVKTAMEAVGTGTYTVTYNRSTKKMTITEVGGTVTNFVILWKTGVNGSDGTGHSSASLLGFTNVDTASGAACTSDSTTSQWSFTHTFTPSNDLEHDSYTFFFQRGLNVLKYNFGQVSQIALESSPDGFVNFNPSVMFQTETTGDIGSPSFDESEELSFQHVTFKIAGSESNEVKTWSLNLLNNLLAKRTYTQSQDAGNFLAIRNEANGSFTVYFENTTERDKFLAATTTSVEILNEGDVISGSIKYAVNILVDRVQYTAFPYGAEDQLLAAQVTWEGRYNTSTTRLYRVQVINTVASY